MKNVKDMTLEEKIELVNDLWDNISKEQHNLPVTDEERVLLNERLAKYEREGMKSREAGKVLADIHKQL